MFDGNDGPEGKFLYTDTIKLYWFKQGFIEVKNKDTRNGRGLTNKLVTYALSSLSGYSDETTSKVF